MDPKNSEISPQAVTLLLQNGNLIVKWHRHSAALCLFRKRIRVQTPSNQSRVFDWKETHQRRVVSLAQTDSDWLHEQLFANLHQPDSDYSLSQTAMVWRQVASHWVTCTVECVAHSTSGWLLVSTTTCKQFSGYQEFAVIFLLESDRVINSYYKLENPVRM